MWPLAKGMWEPNTGVWNMRSPGYSARLRLLNSSWTLSNTSFVLCGAICTPDGRLYCCRPWVIYAALLVGHLPRLCMVLGHRTPSEGLRRALQMTGDRDLGFVMSKMSSTGGLEMTPGCNLCLVFKIRFNTRVNISGPACILEHYPQWASNRCYLFSFIYPAKPTHPYSHIVSCFQPESTTAM